MSRELQINNAKIRKRPALSQRLQMVADLLPPGRRLIDVGTDHAYLPVCAILDSRFNEAVAADIREGPLLKAAGNIERFGLSNKISLKQTNGLSGFEQKPSDVVAISGLGGLEMIDIIKAAPAIWPLLVLQPQKSAAQLRRFLTESGYEIKDERLCLDGNRIYTAMLAEYRSSNLKPLVLDAVDCYLGPVLRREQPPLFAGYLKKQREQASFISRKDPELKAMVETMDQLLAALAVVEPPLSRK